MPENEIPRYTGNIYYTNKRNSPFVKGSPYIKKWNFVIIFLRYNNFNKKWNFVIIFLRYNNSNSFCGLRFFYDRFLNKEKKMQNGKTEPVGGEPEAVQRYSERWGLTIAKGIQIKGTPHL